MTDPTSAVIQAFLVAAISCAKEIEKTHHIPAAATVAIMAHESNYGTSHLSEYDNYGGIKGGDKWPGPQVWIVSRESYGWQKSPFRVYPSMMDFCQDFATLIVSNPNYAPALKLPTTSDGPIKFVKIIGKYYATDPKWTTGVIRKIREHHLLNLEETKWAKTPKPSPQHQMMAQSK